MVVYLRDYPPPPPRTEFTSTHLYTWVQRGAVRVRCITLEHNTMSLFRARTWAALSGVQHTNREATMSLQKIYTKYNPAYM